MRKQQKAAQRPGTLSPVLLAALERQMARSPPGYLPRAVRMGIDYALRVTGPDHDLDQFARSCVDEGRRQQRDKALGDPPPTLDAQQLAERMGPLHSRAFAVLNDWRDVTHLLQTAGDDVVGLPAAAVQLIQAAARGETVNMVRLQIALGQAERLLTEMTPRALRLTSTHGLSS
jgi:hypothetical protein